jgi:putative methionine-R-sulfoxide reductase with GAF domain
MCYEKSEAFIIDDTSISPNHIKDVSPPGSEIAVPIIISEEVIAVRHVCHFFTRKYTEKSLK